MKFIVIYGTCRSCGEEVSVHRNVEPDIPNTYRNVLMRHHADRCRARTADFSGPATCRPMTADEREIYLDQFPDA